MTISDSEVIAIEPEFNEFLGRISQLGKMSSEARVANFNTHASQICGPIWSRAIRQFFENGPSGSDVLMEDVLAHIDIETIDRDQAEAEANEACMQCRKAFLQILWQTTTHQEH